jgi:hypothetical protein
MSPFRVGELAFVRGLLVPGLPLRSLLVRGPGNSLGCKYSKFLENAQPSQEDASTQKNCQSATLVFGHSFELDRKQVPEKH